MSNFFESINPDKPAGGDTVEVAENYWPRKPRDLFPGQIVHPASQSALGMDRKTRKLYLNGAEEFDSRAHQPDSYYGGRFGLMRVYEPVESGETVDGYIIDIRPISPGDILSYDLPDVALYNDEEPIVNDLLPVAGCVYIDVEGNTAYRGDERLLRSAQFLAETVNAVVALNSHPNSQSSSTEGEPTHDDQPAEITDKDI